MLKRAVSAVLVPLALSACIASEVGAPIRANAATNADNRANAVATAAEIDDLEQRWAFAFLNKDFAFIEKIVSPQFKLVGHRGGAFVFPRQEWIANTQTFDIQDYFVKVLDVIVVGDTAVATVEGSWRVAEAGKIIRDDSFFLTDTWVRSHGGWQVIRRHTQATENRLAID